MDASADEPVLIAGAGPVGLTAALALSARGVSAEILEAEPADRERPGSRAIYVHGTTLELLERLVPGLGEQLAEAGLVWPTRRTLYRGTEVFSRTYSTPGGTGSLPHFTSLPQVRTEEFLLEACREAGVEIHWESAVDRVVPGGDGVRVETDDGTVRETPYLVGADGANSRTRSEIGASFEGDRSTNSFVIVDVDEVETNPPRVERRFHYDHPGLDGRNLLVVPFEGGWRVDIQCKVSDDPDDLAREERLSELVAVALDERYADRLSWVSTYQFLQVVADRFVDEHRRVLLAGEAAHLFAPFGARGMNSGMADADAAASAIAVAVEARTDAVAATEVERFAAQREKAAAWNRDAAGQALEHLQGESPVVRAKKRLAAALAPYYEPAGEWLDTAPYGPRGGPPVETGGKY